MRSSRGVRSSRAAEEAVLCSGAVQRVTQRDSATVQRVNLTVCVAVFC